MRTFLGALLALTFMLIPSVSFAQEKMPYEEALKSLKTSSVYVDPSVEDSTLRSDQDADIQDQDKSVKEAVKTQLKVPDNMKVAFLSEPVQTGTDEVMDPEKSAQRIREGIGDSFGVIVYNVDRSSFGVSTGDAEQDKKVQSALTNDFETQGVIKPLNAQLKKVSDAMTTQQQAEEEDKRNKSVLGVLLLVGAGVIVLGGIGFVAYRRYGT